MTAPDVLPLTDEELITRVQQQSADPDRTADGFEALYERTHEGVRRRLLSIVHSEIAAEDLLQEVFVRVWTRAEQWSGQGSFKPGCTASPPTWPQPPARSAVTRPAAARR